MPTQKTYNPKEYMRLYFNGNKFVQITSVPCSMKREKSDISRKSMGALSKEAGPLRVQNVVTGRKQPAQTTQLTLC